MPADPGAHPVDPVPLLARADDIIDIALTFDDNFWAPAYATMRSVCLCEHNPRRLRFHLLHLGLGAEHRTALESIGTEYGAQLVFVDMSHSDILTDRIAHLPVPKVRRLNKIVYARLFLGELLPAEVSRVLFLDCDLMIRGSLEPLFFMDMDGKAIAAVQQPDRFYTIGGRDMRARKTLTLRDPYFNAGVMLIDLDQYRAMDFTATLAPVEPEEMAQFYYDQDILNYCFRGRYLALAPRWNLQNAERAHEALDPIIVHYSANPKPWFIWSRVAFKRPYRHVMTNAYFYQFRRERVRRMVKGWLRLK
jgi:lipopolysaccharide biosynthesis glycosyltransferase